MIRRPPRSTRTDTLFPYTTLFRSLGFPRSVHATERLAVSAAIMDLIEIFIFAHCLAAQIIRQRGPGAFGYDPGFISLPEVDEKPGLLIAEGAKGVHEELYQNFQSRSNEIGKASGGERGGQ